MQNVKKTILRDSPEAASIQTVTGWVSSDGRFWGNNEDTARYAGATHTKCSKNADHPIYAINSYCESCWAEKRQALYEAMPAEPYNGDACMVFDTDQYFWEENEILDYCVDSGINPAELQLVHCVPTYARQIDGKDYFSDDLPEDGELPRELQDAFDALNEVINSKNHVLSWSQGKVKAVLPDEFMERYKVELEARTQARIKFEAEFKEVGEDGSL